MLTDGLFLILRKVSKYRVHVKYIEPGYAQRHGEPPRLYHWQREIMARHAQHARTLVMAQFEHMARSSSVGWQRQVVLVQVTA